jgi:hypothetical protein
MHTEEDHRSSQRTGLVRGRSACRPGRQASPESKPAGPYSLGFQAPGLRENELLLFNNPKIFCYGRLNTLIERKTSIRKQCGANELSNMLRK